MQKWQVGYRFVEIDCFPRALCDFEEKQYWSCSYQFCLEVTINRTQTTHAAPRARCSTSWLDGPPRGQAAAFDSSSPGWSFCRIRGCYAPATISLCGFSFLRHCQRVTWRGGQHFTAQGFEITVLATALVDVWPYIFDPQTSAIFTTCFFLENPSWMPWSRDGLQTKRSFSPLLYDG